MRIQWFQHVPFEGLGSISDWAVTRGHQLAVTRFWADDRLPSLDDFELAIVMGGPMNIYEHERFPWLAPEKVWLRSAVETGRPVLGICLGAQLLADVLGGVVRRNREREIGWFPVRQTPEAGSCRAFAGLPAEFDAFHWHGDTFDLPPGAVALAQSDACVGQAFSWRERVVGLQFHLETTPDSAAALVEHGREDLAPGRFVQSERDILARPDRFRRLNALMGRVLDNLTAGPAAASPKAKGDR